MSWHLCWASLGLFWSGPGLMLVHNTDLEIASFHLFSPWVLPRSTTLTCSFSWFLWSEGWSPLRILASHAIVQPTQLELSYKQAAGEPFVRRPFLVPLAGKMGFSWGFRYLCCCQWSSLSGAWLQGKAESEIKGGKKDIQSLQHTRVISPDLWLGKRRFFWSSGCLCLLRNSRIWLTLKLILGEKGQ